MRRFDYPSGNVVAEFVAKTPTGSSEKVGWSVREWVHASGLSRSTVFNLLRANRLHSVRFGSKRIILTSPGDFLSTLQNESTRS